MATPKVILVSRRDMERDRNFWKRVAAKHGWFAGFKKRKFAMQFFIDEFGKIHDSLYRFSSYTGGQDIFTDRDGEVDLTKRVRILDSKAKGTGK